MRNVSMVTGILTWYRMHFGHMCNPQNSAQWLCWWCMPFLLNLRKFCMLFLILNEGQVMAQMPGILSWWVQIHIIFVLSWLINYIRFSIYLLAFCMLIEVSKPVDRKSKYQWQRMQTGKILMLNYWSLRGVSQFCRFCTACWILCKSADSAVNFVHTELQNLIAIDTIYNRLGDVQISRYFWKHTFCYLTFTDILVSSAELTLMWLFYI